ncbi:ATP synthase F1 subunit epsilon, partial [Polaromonas sp.]|nr:ATP synthase F1 subunit epsilon [Candidatus Saccharibacteria bacterium]
MHFQLVSLSGSKFDDDVYEVTVPTLDGEIGILDHHMPLIAVAKTGVVAVRRQARDTDAQREFFAINGGAIEVENNKLRILVDEADHADEINEAEAAAAMERAKKMKAEATDQVSLEHAQALVDRHAVRIQVANLKRRRNK